MGQRREEGPGGFSAESFTEGPFPTRSALGHATSVTAPGARRSRMPVCKTSLIVSKAMPVQTPAPWCCSPAFSWGPPEYTGPEGAWIEDAHPPAGPQPQRGESASGGPYTSRPIASSLGSHPRGGPHPQAHSFQPQGGPTPPASEEALCLRPTAPPSGAPTPKPPASGEAPPLQLQGGPHTSRPTAPTLGGARTLRGPPPPQPPSPTPALCNRQVSASSKGCMFSPSGLQITSFYCFLSLMNSQKHVTSSPVMNVERQASAPGSRGWN